MVKAATLRAGELMVHRKCQPHSHHTPAIQRVHTAAPARAGNVHPIFQRLPPLAWPGAVQPVPLNTS